MLLLLQVNVLLALQHEFGEVFVHWCQQLKHVVVRERIRFNNLVNFESLLAAWHCISFSDISRNILLNVFKSHAADLVAGVLRDKLEYASCIREVVFDRKEL